MMSIRSLCLLCLVLSVSSGAQARTKKAFVCALTMETQVEHVRATQDCVRGADLAYNCVWGSSADVQIAGAAITLCEAGIAERHQAGYRRAITRCERKYRHKEGTMYQSAYALCHLMVAERAYRKSR